MKHLKTFESLSKPEIENISQDIFWMIIDILEENDIVEASDSDVVRYLYPETEQYIGDANGELDNFWYYGYSHYKDDNEGVKDKLNICFKDFDKYRKVLSILKEDKERIEGYTGVKIDIIGKEPTNHEFATITISIKWKGLSDRVTDIKSFSKFLLGLIKR